MTVPASTGGRTSVADVAVALSSFKAQFEAAAPHLLADLMTILGSNVEDLPPAVREQLRDVFQPIAAMIQQVGEAFERWESPAAVR